MNVEQERTRSLWMETPTPRFGPLTHDAETEVLVIGAGIVGLTTAYELARQGRRVMVVDRGRFARGMTARTTAHLSFECDDFFHELIKVFGRNRARLWCESQAGALDLFERICRDEKIDCDFARLDGYLMAAEDKDIEYLRKELEAAREVGFEDAEWVEAGALPQLDHPAVRFPRQARFHPLKFLNGLIEALKRYGAVLRDDTDIASINETNTTITATTGFGHTIRARQVVVATNSPFHLRVPLHTKQAPYRTYALAAPVPKGSVPDVLLWDTVEPGYHYVRIQPGEAEDMLIVGGEDHKSGTKDNGGERVGALEAWARKRYPQMGEVAYAWSGQVQEPADYVGFIGISPQHERAYLVTGDSGQGITTGGVAALILGDLLMGRENRWTGLYDPHRKMHRSLGEYVKENVEAARHWVELVTAGEVKSVDDIAPGVGALMKHHGKPVAVFRGEDGVIEARSAVCTHAGCVVHWNSYERCWDCPCHGSQFSPDGDVLCGPAATPLAAVSLEDEARASDAENHRPHRGM